MRNESDKDRRYSRYSGGKKKKKHTFLIVSIIVLVVLIIAAVGCFFIMRSLYSDDTDLVSLLLGRNQAVSSDSNVGVGRPEDDGNDSSDSSSVSEDTTETEFDLSDFDNIDNGLVSVDFGKLDKDVTIFDDAKLFGAGFNPFGNLNAVAADNSVLSVYSQPYDDAQPIVKAGFFKKLNAYETSLIHNDTTHTFYQEKTDDGSLTDVRVTGVENFAKGLCQVYWFSAEYVETSLKFQHIAYYFYISLPNSDTSLKMEVSAVSGIGTTNVLTKDLAFDCLDHLLIYNKNS